LLGFGFQIVWFSSQFGSLSARIEDSERRVQAIEANGSPVVQAIRTEVSINSRRISSLEEQYGTKVSGVLTDNAAHAEQLRHLQGNMDSLLQWRVSHIGEDANMDGRLAEIDHQLQQLQVQQTTLIRDLAAIPHPRPRP
jgi:uncharacterized protein involved in exopolysaccharide biosynthesis